MCFIFHDYLYAHNERGPYDVKKCPDCKFRWCGKCGKTQKSYYNCYDRTNAWIDLPSDKEKIEKERHIFVVTGGKDATYSKDISN